jgi:hypothetical protein
MLSVQWHAASADTKACAQRISSVKAFDHNPSNGMIYAIGPPINTSGRIAGHKNTNNGYLRVIHTISTPFSLSVSMLFVNCSTDGVLAGALVR